MKSLFCGMQVIEKCSNKKKDERVDVVVKTSNDKYYSFKYVQSWLLLSKWYKWFIGCQEIQEIKDYAVKLRMFCLMIWNDRIN